MTKEINTKLKLSNVKVIFANFEDEGFGTNITIDATRPEVREAITKWVKENNIGKGDKAGIPNFKEYKADDADPITQFSFKHNQYTKFAAINGTFKKEDLGYGAEISLIANAFLVDNKFMKGTSSSLQAVLLTKPTESVSEDALKELMSDMGIEEVAREDEGLDF